MGFNFINLLITIRSDDCFKLASFLPLSAARYSSICRELCCKHNAGICASCDSRHSCGWFGLFGQELSCDVAALKRHQKPPLPFVYSFPILDSSMPAVSEISCGLIVIGSAIAHANLLLEGLSELLVQCASESRSEITAVACRDFQGKAQHDDTFSIIMKSGATLPSELVITSMSAVLENCLWGASEFCLKLISPLRLLEDRQPLNRFEFGRFARSVMRRVSSLSYYYGERELDWDFKNLSRCIDDVICTEDKFLYSRRHKLQQSGIIGYGHFLGDFSQISCFLAVGSLVHTGKGATYGMGAYELISLQ